MNILITGCNGQLGNEIQLIERDYSHHQFFNTDVAELDICDQQAVDQFVAGHAIDGIINCAAYTAVDKAESDKEMCTTLNTVAPAYLANAIQQRQDPHPLRGGQHPFARQRIRQHQTCL